jgi:hypothetical protein
MENKVLEIFIPGPAGRLEAKYFKSKKNTSPIALVLQPHPQYGGTMNNKVVVETFNTFIENNFSVCRVNFRGVGKSDGEFDNGQGELADAAAALDWLERENFDNSQRREKKKTCLAMSLPLYTTYYYSVDIQSIFQLFVQLFLFLVPFLNP